MLTKSVTRAMSVQLERVNRTAPAADLRAEIDRLQRENAELRLLLAAYEDSAPAATPRADAHIYNGRPVIDIKTAAARAGVSVATAWRYCESRYWEAAQDANRRWLVYADQSLSKRKRK